VYNAVPDIALIHYNTAYTKKIFHGCDYARVLPRVSTLIGSKAAMTINDYMELVVNAPEMNHFTGESVFPLSHLLGGKGMYTSWFMMNPAFFHDYYQMCVDRRYEEAIAISLRLTKWHETAVRPLIQKGYLHATLDKAFVEIGGWLPGNRRTRKPHQPITAKEFGALKRLTAGLMPEFVSYRP